MVVTGLYILLSLLALSFLIFIHELGHYWMARRVGMRVETFAIGFGKPLYTWKRDGVEWRLNMLLFGGYVKIAGQETDSEKDPYEIPDGFFGKSPWARIKVAFAGPLMNILLALLLFILLWAIGGREKDFNEFTAKIGWVDPQSELYLNGVRPGDEITAYDAHPFVSNKDHLYAPMTANEMIDVQGYKLDYPHHKRTPFSYEVKVYPHPMAVRDSGVMTTGILDSASYLIYDKLPGIGNHNTLPEGSPMEGSGIELGDRIVWVDGQVVFSLKQLSALLNDDRVLLTIQRDDETFLRRVPRVQFYELRAPSFVRDEIVDWQYAANLGNDDTKRLWVLPYNLTPDLVVEGRLPFVDNDSVSEVFPEVPTGISEEPLNEGDRIIAINGNKVDFAYELLENLQERKVSIIVERNPSLQKSISWQEADAEFNESLNWQALQNLAAGIGSDHEMRQDNNLILLDPVTPKKRSELFYSDTIEDLMAKQRRKIEEIEDPDQRAEALSHFENQENLLLLGLKIQDRKVRYNPTPLELFSNVVGEIGRTLTALVTGALNPKWMSGPVGIIQVVHQQSMVSLKESLFWIAVISLNLGVINLLPIPVLDGGTIVFSLYEMITRQRLAPKTMEKLVIPFAILLIMFFIFLTYNDISRLFRSLFS